MACKRGEETDDSVPEEIEETCLEVHEALAGVDRLLKPALAVSRGSLEEKVSCKTVTNSGVSIVVVATVGRAGRCLSDSAVGIHYELTLLG